MPCDTCGKQLDLKKAKILTPNDMRVIAHNGYGETVPILAALPLAERRAKFQALAYADNTDWALCSSCYDSVRPYMADANPGGMTVSDTDLVRELGLKPLLDELHGKPLAPSGTERVGHADLMGEAAPHETYSFGRPPMFAAARDGKLDTVRALIADGVDVNAPIDRDGRTPLYYAADNGHDDVVRLLLASGATLDALDNFGLSALYVCALSLANKVLNVPDKTGWQRAQNSNPTGHAAVAETLIRAGADVRLAPKGYRTPEQFIREVGLPRHLTLLKERANATPKRSFWSALFGA